LPSPDLLRKSKPGGQVRGSLYHSLCSGTGQGGRKVFGEWRLPTEAKNGSILAQMGPPPVEFVEFPGLNPGNFAMQNSTGHPK